MRTTLVIAALVAVSMAGAPRAEAATTWCANNGEDTVCGFVSFQQCLDFAAGTNAFCDVDNNPLTTQANTTTRPTNR